MSFKYLPIPVNHFNIFYVVKVGKFIDGIGYLILQRHFILLILL